MVSLIVGEVLSIMLKEAASKGIFRGISTSEQITHLQFADDTVIFLDGTLSSAKGVKSVLQCFQLLSGLKINYEKSEIFASSSVNNELSETAAAIGCKIGV